MDKKKFGNLVSILRKEQRNEFDKIMTQYDLSEEARISLITIQKIEQGRQVNLKPEMILSLANSLRLSAQSRESFIICASRVEESSLYSSTTLPTKALEEIKEKLAQLQAPGYIMDCYGDVLFTNRAFSSVYATSPERLFSPNILTQFNIIRILLSKESSQLHRMMKETVHSFARRMVLLYKAMTVKYRTSWYFQQILPELNRIPLFRENWQSLAFQDEDVFANYNMVQLNHAQWGMLNFLSSPIKASTIYGDLYLCSSQPMDTLTSHACAKIMQQVGTDIIKYSDWPKKNPKTTLDVI